MSLLARIQAQQKIHDLNQEQLKQAAVTLALVLADVKQHGLGQIKPWTMGYDVLVDELKSVIAKLEEVSK